MGNFFSSFPKRGHRQRTMKLWRALCKVIVFGMIIMVIPMVKGNEMVKIKRTRPLELEVEWEPQADTRLGLEHSNIPTTHSRVQPCRSYAFVTEHVSLENASTRNIHVCVTISKTPKSAIMLNIELVDQFPSWDYAPNGRACDWKNYSFHRRNVFPWVSSCFVSFIGVYACFRADIVWTCLWMCMRLRVLAWWESDCISAYMQAGEGVNDTRVVINANTSAEWKDSSWVLLLCVCGVCACMSNKEMKRREGKEEAKEEKRESRKGWEDRIQILLHIHKYTHGTHTQTNNAWYTHSNKQHTKTHWKIN